MIKILPKIFSLLFLINFSSKIFAQNTLPINLEKVLELADANNLTLQKYKEQQALAEAKLAKAKEWWLPEVFGGIRTHQLSGAAMNGNGNFFIDVDRDNLWAGLGLDLNWDFGSGIFQIKAAKLNAEAREAQNLENRNQTLLNIIETYYDFLVAQQYFKAYQELANQTETIAQQLDYQLEVGLGYESDALLAQSNVHHLKVKMLGAKSEFGQKTVILVRLLNLDPKTKLVSMDSVISPLDLPTNFKIIEFENAHLQTHPKYLAGNIKLESLKTEKKTATLGLLLPEFRIGAYGSYFGDLNDPVSPMVPSQFPETNQLYSTSEVNASLLWRIPLGNLVYGGDVKTFNSKINLQQLENEQIETEINADVLMAKERLAAAKEQIELAFEGNQLAEKAMQQSLQRQALKTIRPFELLQTQQVFIQSRLDYLEAISAFNKAQFALRVAKGERL